MTSLLPQLTPSQAAVQDVLNENEGIRPVFNPAPEPHPSPPTPPSPPAPPPAPPQIRSELEERLVSFSLGNLQTIYCSEIAIAPILRRPVTVVLPRQQGWWEWLVNLAFFPLRFVINTTSELMQFVGEWYKHCPV